VGSKIDLVVQTIIKVASNVEFHEMQRIKISHYFQIIEIEFTVTLIIIIDSHL
jgi:hypothetical protein